MKSAKQLGLWTTEELKQDQRNKISGASEFNNRVRLAKHLLATADEQGLENLVPDEAPIPQDYEEPQIDTLLNVGPGSRISVCYWKSNYGYGGIGCRNVFVTQRSGDELCGLMRGGLFEDDETISFDLKHICYVENDGDSET